MAVASIQCAAGMAGCDFHEEFGAFEVLFLAVAHVFAMRQFSNMFKVRRQRVDQWKSGSEGVQNRSLS